MPDTTLPDDRILAAIPIKQRDQFISIEQALHPAAEPTLNLPLTDLPLLRPRNGAPTDRGRFAGLGLGGSSGRS